MKRLLFFSLVFGTSIAFARIEKMETTTLIAEIPSTKFNSLINSQCSVSIFDNNIKGEKKVVSKTLIDKNHLKGFHENLAYVEYKDVGLVYGANLRILFFTGEGKFEVSAVYINNFQNINSTVTANFPSFELANLTWRFNSDVNIDDQGLKLECKAK